MKRILALVFALTACMVLAVGCAASSSNASSATSSATSAAKSSSAASSQAQSSSTASTTATSEEAPTASEVVPESEWGTLFAVFGDEAVAFGQRVQSELPASAFAEYDGVASGEPIEFTDPGQIRALFNALAQSNAVEGADEIRTDDYTRFWFVFADGSRQSFFFDSMTVQKTVDNSYVFYTVDPMSDLTWFIDAAKGRFLEG